MLFKFIKTYIAKVSVNTFCLEQKVRAEKEEGLHEIPIDYICMYVCIPTYHAMSYLLPQ